MEIERNKIAELLGDESLSKGLKKLQDDQEVRKVFSTKFSIPLPDSLVFHGSPKEIESFRTNVSLGGANENKEDALIYASSEPDYAIFLALLDIQKGGSASVTCGNGEVKKSVTVGFVNGESKINEGYLYILDGKDFIAHDNAELTSGALDLKPIFHIGVTVTDLESSIVIN